MAEPELWMTTDGGQCDGELTLHHEVTPLRVRRVPFDEAKRRGRDRFALMMGMPPEYAVQYDDLIDGVLFAALGKDTE